MTAFEIEDDALLTRSLVHDIVHSLDGFLKAKLLDTLPERTLLDLLPVF